MLEWLPLDSDSGINTGEEPRIEAIAKLLGNVI
jgi:hypothetical protein